MIAGHTKFYYLEVAGVSPQPAVGLALPRPGVVGVGDVPAPSVSALPSLVPAHHTSRSFKAKVKKSISVLRIANNHQNFLFTDFRRYISPSNS